MPGGRNSISRTAPSPVRWLQYQMVLAFCRGVGGQWGFLLVVVVFGWTVISFFIKIKNMNELSFTPKLDLVLKHLVIISKQDGANRDKDGFDKIAQDLSRFIDRRELKEILGKLKKDGYIEWQIEGNDVTTHEKDTRYIVTFEGQVLNELNGYSQQEIDKEQERNFIKTSEKARSDREALLVSWTASLSNRTRDLTKWTKVVGIGAVGLVLWEIIVYCLEHFSHSCH